MFMLYLKIYNVTICCMLEYSYLYEMELAMHFLLKFQIVPISTNEEVETCFIKILIMSSLIEKYI